MPKRKVTLFSLLSDVLLDLALIGAGVVLYLVFAPEPQRLAAFLPAVAAAVGGADNLVRIVAGLPFLVGVFSLLKTIGQALRSLLRRSPSETR